MIFVIIFVLIIDTLAFKGVLHLLNRKDKHTKMVFITFFWIIPLSLFTSVFLIMRTGKDTFSVASQYHMYLVASLFVLFYLPKLVFIGFHLFEDLIRAIRWVIHKLWAKKTETEVEKNNPISRLDFISKTGLIVASIPFASILWGTAFTRFSFKIFQESIAHKLLPTAFNGLRIVQISDLHLGSYYGHYDELEKAVDKINELKPDVIFFTGDMVSDNAEELKPCIDILKGLTAPLGKYSILGNHDYGDYHNWPTTDAKEVNFNLLLEYQNLCGFQVLRNESVILERDLQEIAIIGVENWGKPPFAQYGDFKKAQKQVSDLAFKILLSHDPSHWDAEILGKTDIALCLSGHTHGFQFGVDFESIKWSPVQLKYPRWAGLYKANNQYLYVNRGLGCIGYMGRVGIHPEITLLELRSSD